MRRAEVLEDPVVLFPSVVSREDSAAFRRPPSAAHETGEDKTAEKGGPGESPGPGNPAIAIESNQISRVGALPASGVSQLSHNSPTHSPTNHLPTHSCSPLAPHPTSDGTKLPGHHLTCIFKMNFPQGSQDTAQWPKA